MDGLRTPVFGPQSPADWLVVLVAYLVANALTVVILMVAYRGMVRGAETQLDSKVPGGVASNAPAVIEREAAPV